MNLLQKINALECEIAELDQQKIVLERKYAKDNANYKKGDIVNVELETHKVVKVKVLMVFFSSSRLLYYTGIILNKNGEKMVRRNGINFSEHKSIYHRNFIVD